MRRRYRLACRAKRGTTCSTACWPWFVPDWTVRDRLCRAFPGGDSNGTAARPAACFRIGCAARIGVAVLLHSIELRLSRDLLVHARSLQNRRYSRDALRRQRVTRSMTLVFFGFILLSLVLAIISKRGHAHQKAADFFVASGQFSSVLFFFLAVGETYSVATILGFPGGVYASGTGFVTWFLGYILLAFVVGYFLNPLIWRAGRVYGALTLSDLFRRHFDSRLLEVVVTSASLIFLVPLGMMQFLGVEIVLRSFGWAISPLMLAGFAGMLAFSYIAISGIRASAYVAILKDVLLIAAILLTGLAALKLWGGNAHAATTSAAWRHAMQPTLKGDMFSITTILLQSVGFCMVPQTCAYVFTARSASTVRRAQVTMPLYMVMFPFLTVVSYYALAHPLHLQTPNDVFLATAQTLLPAPLVGMVMAGAALSALVVLTGICLAIGPLVTRNLVPGLSDDRQRRWSQVVMALYLLLSVGGAATSSQLMVTINNLFYFGVTQSFPGMLAILFLRRTRPSSLVAGIVAGDAVAIALYELNVSTGGINPGFIGLLVNLAIVFGALALWPGPARVPISAKIEAPASRNVPPLTSPTQ
ncbi:MAG: sodium:solute symporter family protein [Rhizomicrobium sp.]